MKYIFEVLGDSDALGKAEIAGAIESYKREYKILENQDGILVLDTQLELERFVSRLGLTRTIDEHLVSGDTRSIMKFLEDYHFKPESFCVRAKRIKNHQPEVSTQQLQTEIGDILSKNSKVELKNPKAELRLVISEKIYAGLKMMEIRRMSFEDRKVKHRPFFSPISLHPKLARALVNLSRVKEGETLLDPFCGTGGILIEAGLIGARIIGSDIKKKMVDGCMENLKSLDLKCDLFKADVSDVPNRISSVDAIATDPPYGRSASTGGEDIGALYKRSFQSFKKILKKDGYLSIILPKKEHVDLGSNYFELKEFYDVRVHGSLTRFFSVFKMNQMR